VYAGDLVVKIVEAGGREHHLAYDQFQQLNRVTSSDLRTVRYVWDSMGLGLVTIQSVDGISSHYEYFLKGEDGILAAVISAGGNSLKYSYESNKVTITNEDGAESYSYVSGSWNLYESPNGKLSVTRDTLKRPLEVKRDGELIMRLNYLPITGAFPPVSPAIKYETPLGIEEAKYDENFLPTEVSRNGIVSKYVYSQTGSAWHLTSSITGAVKSDLVRNAAGQVIEERYAGVPIANIDRDTAGRVTKHTDADGNVRIYSYENNGQISSIAKNGIKKTFSHTEVSIGQPAGFELPPIPTANPETACLYGTVCTASGASLVPPEGGFQDSGSIPPAISIAESISTEYLDGSIQTQELVAEMTSNGWIYEGSDGVGGQSDYSNAESFGGSCSDNGSESESTTEDEDCKCKKKNSSEGESPECNSKDKKDCEEKEDKEEPKGSEVIPPKRRSPT